ncbi:MAG: hypothetical protein P8J33_02020 [Pirellulaceae bacterium]|nr:hypothetical protein [Pirellulaceae bacterium]
MSSPSQIESDAHWPAKLHAAWRQISGGQVSAVELLPPANNANPAGKDGHRKVLLPGSFNPLHRGHVGMANWVARHLSLPVWFEFSFVNADKPEVDFIEIQRRLGTFSSGYAVSDIEQPMLQTPPHGLLLTSNAKFACKARAFPGCCFAVGVDTLSRIAEPRFYENQTVGRDQAMEEIAGLGCRFLVFGRLSEGRFQTLPSMQLPESLARLCDPVQESTFRVDVSSTQIRKLG